MAEKTYAVARTRDLRDGEAKEVTAGETKVLLTRINGDFHAVGANCPHYGMSLAEGLLCGERITCPWHKASFNVVTGRHLEPPAMNNLARYPVAVRDGLVFVTICEPEVSKPVQVSDTRQFVIAGGGAAGVACAEALREFGFTGRISLVHAEPEPPYDRTKLSKEFLSGNAGEAQLPLRPANFYEMNAIEMVPGRVADITAAEQEVELEDGTTVRYDRLLVATGSIPRTLEVPGAGLGNVFPLRSLADAKQIERALRPGVRAVLVGGSFIALEMASCLAMRKIPVVIVVPERQPFERQFGVEVGRAFCQWHEQHGVQFRLGISVERLSGTGMVHEVVLQSGERLLADVVVIGTGVKPNTDMSLQLPLREDGGMVVDEHLCAAEHIYAAGDIAAFPNGAGDHIRVEHWRVAEQHGRTAAANMLGRKEAYSGVPYFWTNHFGTRFDYIGHASKWTEVIVDGDLTKPDFIAYYIEKDAVIAAAACQRDLEIAALEELMRRGRRLAAEEIRRGTDLIAMAQDRAQFAVA